MVFEELLKNMVEIRGTKRAKELAQKHQWIVQRLDCSIDIECYPITYYGREWRQVTSSKKAAIIISTSLIQEVLLYP